MFRFCGNVGSDCSSDSGCYRPGFRINYYGESSLCSGSEYTSAPMATKTTSSKSSSNSSNSSVITVVSREVIKERCRIAYTNSGSSTAIEGHAKI